MGVSVEKMQVGVCDNPECGRRVVVYPDDPIPGVLGNLQVHGPWGGHALKFFSCDLSASHVAMAIAAVLECGPE